MASPLNRPLQNETLSVFRFLYVTDVDIRSRGLICDSSGGTLMDSSGKFVTQSGFHGVSGWTNVMWFTISFFENIFQVCRRSQSLCQTNWYTLLLQTWHSPHTLSGQIIQGSDYSVWYNGFWRPKTWYSSSHSICGVSVLSFYSVFLRSWFPIGSQDFRGAFFLTMVKLQMYARIFIGVSSGYIFDVLWCM